MKSRTEHQVEKRLCSCGKSDGVCKGATSCGSVGEEEDRGVVGVIRKGVARWVSAMSMMLRRHDGE